MTEPTTRTVFIVSDGTAITAEAIAHSLLAQFPEIDFYEETIPYVDTVRKANAVVELVDRTARHQQLRPLVVSTVAEPGIRSRIAACSSALILDMFDAFLGKLQNELHAQALEQTGLFHRITNPTRYDSRIAAINFTLAHDDGGSVRHYDQSELVLIGVSRTGKTPVSLYLALQFGIRAANYPLTEEDLGGTLPRVLLPHRGKLYGLTIDPERLHQIRTQRRPGSPYAAMEQCTRELRAAEDLYRTQGIPFVNTSTRSVEEIATKIVQERGLRRTKI